MGGITLEQNRVTLANHNFTLLMESRMLGFFGSWTLQDYASDVIYPTFTSFDFLVNLNDRNYLIHPEDYPVMQEIVADLKPDRQAHLKIRVISPDGKVHDLEGIGYLRTFDEPNQKKTQALKHNEDLLNSILENTTSSIMALKPVRGKNRNIIDLEYVFVNHQTLKSVNRDSLVGKYFLKEFPEIKTKTKLFENYCSVIQTGKPWHDIVHIDFGGVNEDVWAHVNAVKWKDCCLVTYTDISEQKKAERTLQENNETISKIAATTPDLITVQDANTNRILYRNDNDFWKDLLDIDIYQLPEEERIQHMVHPDDRDKVKKFLADRILLKNDDIAETDIRLVNDNWIRVRSRVFKRGADGNATEIISITSNVTAIKKHRDNLQKIINVPNLGIGAETAERVWTAVERAKAEEALRKNEEKFRTLFSSMDEGYCIMQMLYDNSGKAFDWVHLQVNHAFEINSGLHDAEGKTIRELVPNIEQKWIEIYDRIAQNGESVRFEEDSAALGRIFTLYAFRIGDPAERKVAVIFKDITQQKHAEEALRESEQKLRKRESELSLVQEIGKVAGIDIIVDNDVQQSYSWRSPEYQKLHGLLPGTEYETYQDWLQRVHPEDRERANLTLVSAVKSDVPMYQSEYRIIRPMDGKTRWIFARVDIIRDETGQPVRLVGAHIDITERKNAEELLRESESRYRSQLEQEVMQRTLELAHTQERLTLALIGAGAGSWHWDLHSNNIQGDKHAMNLLGISESEGTKPVKQWITKIYEPDREHVIAAAEACFYHDKDFRVEFRTMLPTGELRYMQCAGYVFKNSKGNPEHAYGLLMDTTERKTAEQLARVTQELLQTIYDNIPIGISILEPVYDKNQQITDFRIKLVNKELERATQRVDLIGKLYTQEYPGIKTTGLFDIMLRVMETGRTEQLEYYYPFEGFNKWFSGTFIKTREGLVATNSDITERRRSQAELVKNYQILKQSEEVAGIGSWDFEIQTGQFIWSEGMYRLFGLPYGTPVTPEIYDHAIIPEDYPKAQKIIAHFRTNPQSFEETIRIRPNGKIRTLKVKGSVLNDETGKPSRIIGIDLDITALIEFEQENLRMQKIIAQQAKDKYQQLFNSIDQGFCIVEMIYDSEGHAHDYRFIETNPAFETQTGLKDAIGKTIGELIPTYDKHGLEMYANVARDQRPIRFIQQAGFLEDRWYDVYAFPIGGYHNSVAILFLDITKRKRAEIELKKLNFELKKLDEVKTAFFSNISHEFRTPITLLLGPLNDVIKSNASLLPGQQLDKLLMAQRNATRLQKLVNSLLDFSRFEAGQADAIFQPTDIVRFTTELAGNFRSAIEDAGLKFIIKCEDPKEPVYLNHDMYEKIVLNLLSNAFKFTFKGKIELKIRDKKKKVELRVLDTGIGIASHYHARIFERFNRIESSRSRTFEGTGIGLALVKEMVEVHGGDINLKSIPGKGSEFIVTIPKGKSHLAPGKIYESRDQLTASNIYPYLEEIKSWQYEVAESKKSDRFTLKPTVLLADDNADMRSYLSIILQPRFQVIKTENGRKAWDIIKSGFIPDVLLADVMMPDMNGYELLEYIRSNEKYQRLPVILISARADETSRIEGMNSGADDYLVKPFAPRELIARIDARIQIARLRDQAEGQLAVNNELLENVVRQRTQELKKSNDLLERKNHELQGLYDELNNLTFIASHDLREPLRKLSIFTEVVNREEHSNLSKEGKEHLHKIVSCVQRMNDLVSDMSRYSNFSGRPVRLVHNSMNQIVFTVKASLKKLMHDKDITLETDVHDAIQCDPVQIKQLLLNLLSNAIKFSKAGVPLHINLYGKVVSGTDIIHPLAEKDHTYYVIEVTDNGIGFEQRFEDRIFHIFRKLHHQLDYPGTGIGLAICRKIVENHKGFIVAKSLNGEGSSFSAYIPQ